MRHKRDGSSTSAISVPQQIKYRATDSILPNPRNARTHSAQQIQQIARSIERFGFNNPVLVDQNNQIIAGHGRVAAAKLLGYDTVPTLRIEHLSDEEKRAYIIADNRLAERAGWDPCSRSAVILYTRCWHY